MENVVLGFFVVLAATLNVGFFVGDLSDPALHNLYELFAAVVVNLLRPRAAPGRRRPAGAAR